jgi:transposase InsO family protein
VIDLVKQHAERYPNFRAEERLKQIGLTSSSYHRFCNGVYEKTVRESAIPEEDIEAAVNFFIGHPDVGAGKARVSLIDKEQAYISTSNINEIKQELVRHAEDIYKQRKEEEKQLEAQLREALLACRQENTYEHQRAQYPHHIWAMDFVNITFLSMRFVLSIVYDEYSQAYLSLCVGFGADYHLALANLREALERTGTSPEFVRRDNGKPFLTEDFQRELENAVIEDYPTPPHSPWYNGSLESCNTSLKAAIRTTGMQEMAKGSIEVPHARQDPEIALAILKELSNNVQIMLNEEISRCKHNMPPAKVLAGERQKTKKNHEAFVEKKKLQRQERMASKRAQPKDERNPKTMLDKARGIIKRAIGKLDTNTLYVFNEVLHNSYRMFAT